MILPITFDLEIINALDYRFQCSNLINIDNVLSLAIFNNKYMIDLYLLSMPTALVAITYLRKCELLSPFFKSFL